MQNNIALSYIHIYCDSKNCNNSDHFIFNNNNSNPNINQFHVKIFPNICTTVCIIW